MDWDGAKPFGTAWPRGFGAELCAIASFEFLRSWGKGGLLGAPFRARAEQLFLYRNDIPINVYMYKYRRHLPVYLEGQGWSLARRHLQQGSLMGNRSGTAGSGTSQPCCAIRDTCATCSQAATHPGGLQARRAPSPSTEMHLESPGASPSGCVTEGCAAGSLALLHLFPLISATAKAPG